jgi:hypothetical protein
MSFEHNIMAAAFMLSCVLIVPAVIVAIHHKFKRKRCPECGARMKKVECFYPGGSIESCIDLVCLKCEGVE